MITLTFEFITVTLQGNEILKTGNPLYPIRKMAKNIQPGELVNIGGFYTHLV